MFQLVCGSCPMEEWTGEIVRCCDDNRRMVSLCVPVCVCVCAEWCGMKRESSQVVNPIGATTKGNQEVRKMPHSKEPTADPELREWRRLAARHSSTCACPNVHPQLRTTQRALTVWAKRAMRAARILQTASAMHYATRMVGTKGRGGSRKAVLGLL